MTPMMVPLTDLAAAVDLVLMLLQDPGAKPSLAKAVMWVTALIVLIGQRLLVALLSSTTVLALLRTVPVMLSALVWAGCRPPYTDLSTRAVATIGPFVVRYPRTRIPRSTGILLVGILMLRLLWVITTLLSTPTTLLTPPIVVRYLTPETTPTRSLRPLKTPWTARMLPLCRTKEVVT